MEKEQTKENILPSMKNVDLMELFPKILDVEKETFKMTPSEYIKELSLSTDERHKRLVRIANNLTSAVSGYPAQFKIIPHILVFQKFEAMTTNRIILEVKNVGKTLLSVKMHCPSSLYFSTNFIGVPMNKLAPGLSVEFEITFTPKEERDYDHYLVFTSKEQSFQVPIVAIGPRPMLDIPDQIILNPSPVKIPTDKFIVVRNIGNAAAVFNFISQGPHFHVSPSKGILGVQDSMLLKLTFESSEIKEVTEQLHLVLETGEKILITLHGAAENVCVRLEKNSVVHDDTFMGLKRSKTVRLINNSSHIIKFSWRKNKCQSDDLVIIESLRDKYKELAELEILKNAKVIHYGLGDAERHKVSCERILNDEMRFLEKEEFKFADETFSIYPESGEVWPKGSAEIIVAFEPKTCGTLTAEAYLEVSGRNSRLPLRMKGVGLGPKIVLNVKTLDIHYIYLCSSHKYEIVAENRGDIPGTLEYIKEALVFGGKVEVTPTVQELNASELAAFVLSFKSNRPGEFIEKISFTIKESGEIVSFVFKGNIVSPTLHFDIKQLDFGNVPFGVPIKREVNLNNLSVVPVMFSLRVVPDGDFPSISCEQFARYTIKPAVPQNPKEFGVDPEESVVEPFSSKKVTVILTANKVGKQQKQLVVDMWDSENGSTSCPILYKAQIANLMVDPEMIVIPFCFINYPYSKTITLNNISKITAFFYFVPTDPHTETSVTFSASVPQGIIEPRESIKIDITIITSALGRQYFPVNVLTFGLEEPRQMCTISCVGQGPVVSIKPISLNWGDIVVLEKVEKVLEFLNESPIPAIITLNVVKTGTLWELNPSNFTMMPQKTAKVTITLLLKDRGKLKDNLKVNVYNGKDLVVPLQANGVGSSLKITPMISPNYYLGTLFSQKKYEFEVLLENKGNKIYNLVWSPYSEYKAFANSKFIIPEDIPFKLSPTKMDVLPNERKMMNLEVYSKGDGYFKHTFYCFANCGSSTKELHLISEMSADFTGPMISCDKDEVHFWNCFGPEVCDVKVNDIVTIKNRSVLPLIMELTITHPFCLETETDNCVYTFELKLEGQESKELNLKFLAPPNPKKNSKIYNGKMMVTFKEYSKKFYVALTGEVSYPSVSIQPKKIDFGYVQVGTNACMEVNLLNISPLTVYFDLKWDVKSCNVYHFETEVSMKALPSERNDQTDLTTPSQFNVTESFVAESQTQVVESSKNENPSEMSQPCFPPTKPVPRMPEIKISDSDIKKALFPMARGYYRCDHELMEAYRMVRTSDEIVESMPNMNDFCDITPFYGKLEPFSSQILTVVFFSNVPVKVHAEAIMNIEGGPKEVILIDAVSSEIAFQLSSTELNFGKQLFCETKNQILKIRNAASMPFTFETIFENECEAEENFPLGRGVMTVSPKSGTIQSLKTAELIVRYHPGMPGLFENNFKLQIAYLDPITINVKGTGVFPQVYVTLPRPDILKVSPEIGYSAVASITPDWILTDFPNNYCLYNWDPLKPYRSLESNVDFITDDDSDEKSWEFVKYMEFMPSEVDIYLAIERSLAYKLISCDTNSALFAVYARTIPRFNVPAYDLDFGVCLIGQAAEQQVTIMNFGPLPVVIYGIFDSHLKEEGFHVRLKNRNELKIGGCLSFTVSFVPKKSKYKKKYTKFEFIFFFEIYHGPKIPIKILAEVTYPHVIPSMYVLNFNEVICGCCKVINLKIKNPGLVTAKWFMFTKRSGETMQGLSPDIKDSNSVFHFDYNSGVLNPDEYCTVQVSFKPACEDSFSGVLYIQVTKSLETLKILLMGSGIEPRLSISRKILDFKSTLPFPNKAEKVFTVSNPCAFPLEFYFPIFDEQIFEEEKILRALTAYYRTDEVCLPVRQPGEGLPAEIVEFYNMLLDGLNAKFMENEREKMQAEALEENVSPLSVEDDSLLASSQMSFSENRKKKKLKKWSRSRTSMEANRDMGSNANGRESNASTVFEQKTPEEIEDMLEDYIKCLWGSELSYDPIQAANKHVLQAVVEEEHQEGTLVICHGAPQTNYLLLANRLARLTNISALSIDNIVLTEAAFGRNEAGLLAKDTIENAYYEYFGMETKESTPLAEWGESRLSNSEENFNFENNFEDIQQKFIALVQLRENLASGKWKGGVPDTAKSEASRKPEKMGTPFKPQMNLNAPLANMPEDLVIEILKYRLSLEVGEGVVIESLQSVFILSPINALLSLLKAAGNIKNIIFLCFLSNYEEYNRNQLNIQAEQELAKAFVHEEIIKILEEEPEEVFQSLNLKKDEAEALRQEFLTSRHESNLMFERKKGTFYEMQRLRREAKKKGLPMPKQPLFVTLDTSPQPDKSGKKDAGKGAKSSAANTNKTESGAKSARPKQDSVEGEFLSFELSLIEMKTIIDCWDQRLGAIVVEPGSDVKIKKGQTPNKSEPAAASKLSDARGGFLWLLDVSTSQNSFLAVCSQLSTILQERYVFSESDAWPLDSTESTSFSVYSRPPKRTKPILPQVFTISATDNVVLSGEDPCEDLGESRSIVQYKLNRSASSISVQSKKRECGTVRRRKTDSRMSIDLRNQKSKKAFSAVGSEEFWLKPRWILQPGETQTYRVKYYPVMTGFWKEEFVVELLNWKNEDVILCKGVCDFPRIDSRPEALFPAVLHNKPLTSIYEPAYYYSEEAYDFGSIIIFQSGSVKKSSKKSTAFTVSNISTLPVDLSVVFAEDGTSEEHSSSENFVIEPDKLWLKPEEQKTITVTVSPSRNGVITETILLVIKDNPKVESIKLSCEGVKPSVSINPRLVNFERLLLRRKDFRRLVLTNDNMIPLYFGLKGLDTLPSQLTFSHVNGMIPPLGSFVMQIFYNATEVQLINDKTVQVQVFDSPDSQESVQDLHFLISMEAYDAALDIIFANYGEDHIDFGDIRVEKQYAIEFNLKNVGKYPLGFKFDIDAALLSESGNEQFYVIPQDGKLPPGKLFPVTVTFMALTEVLWKREPLFKITLVEPFCADELIAAIPIEVSARSHFSRFEIKPSEDLNFGHIRVGSVTTGSILIENKGHFSLTYFVELQTGGHALDDNVEAKKSSKVSTASKEKGDKWKKSLHSILKAGIFEVSPSSNVVETGQTAVVTITCCPNEVKSYEETLVIFVNECLPHLKKGKTMTISAEACLPVILFYDYKSIFREHLVWKDETEITSRTRLGSYTVYIENKNMFSFRDICVNKTAEARLHFQNTGLIDCPVTASVESLEESEGGTHASQSSAKSEYFKIFPERLMIEAYNIGCFLLTFQPDALETYRGRLTITLGKPDPYKDEVQVFNLFGNGILPQIEITEPSTKLPEGQALVNFPPTSPGHTSSSSIAFSNTGLLDCKVIVELYKNSQNGTFSLCPKSGTEKLLKIWELSKPIEHTAIVSLSPGQVAEFTVTFAPVEIQSYTSQIKLFIVDNPFENWCYKLVGEVFFEEVVIEKIRTSMPFLGKEESDNKLSTPATPGQYFINLSECYVNKKSKVLFRLTNKTAKEYFKFEWDEVQGVTLIPAVGHLYPNSYKEILLVFHPEEPMELEDVTISCILNKIVFVSPPEPSWDSRLIQHQKQSSVSELLKLSGEEPEHELVPESNRVLYVNLSGIADYTRLSCETTKILFKNTFMFQNRMYPLVLENTGNVALEYKLSLKTITIWPLKEDKKSQVEEQVFLKIFRPNSRPHSSGQLHSITESNRSPTLASKCVKRPRPFSSVSVLDLNRSTSESEEQPVAEISEEEKTTYFNPFRIENATGRIPSKEKAFCNIIFSPMDINEYKTAVTIQVPNLHPDCCLPEIQITASSIMPYCHFDIPESDYLESGRREYSRPGPIGYSPGVPLHPDTKTIEIKVLGIGVTIPIKFHGINPTEEDYTFSWVNTTQIQPDVVPSFHCSTVDGWIRAGRQQLMVFNFISQKIGITESFWKFSIPKYGVETPFLFVGDVRKPSVYFLSTHVNLMPTLIGSSSSHVVTLVNHEENPFDFYFVPESLYSEGRLNVLTVEPASGKILGNSETTIRVMFTGKTPGKSLFNARCRVKSIKEPFIITVEATTYVVQPLVAFEDLKKLKHIVELNKDNVIDFGSELRPNYPETITLTLTSLSKTSFYYEWDYEEKILEVRHCCIRFSTKSGHVPAFSRGKCDVVILFHKKSSLMDFPLKLKIRRGPTFLFLIRGSASTPLCELSFKHYDFGYCFLQEKDICFNETSLVLRNKDTTDLVIECVLEESKAFSYSLPETVIHPAEEMTMALRFHPKECIPYEDVLRLTINGNHERIVHLTGHGTEFKVTLADAEDTTISLGAVKIGKTSTRKFSLVNKSLATATLLVGFSDQLPVSGSHLTQSRKGQLDLSHDHRLAGVITISPSTVFRIKPHEEFILSITYTPGRRSSPFSETVYMQCQEKVEPLCVVTGCCLGPEISLDRYFLNFGVVVESCSSSMRLKLVNSGSIGARFEWNTESLTEYFLSPSSGYCSPESDVTIKVTFCPSAVQICIKKTVECRLYLAENETYPSLWLNLTGDCIALPKPKDVVAFECFVRERVTKEIEIENPSGSEWQLIPIISGEYFKGYEALVVPPLSSAVYQIEFCPLMMSPENSHQGSVFFKLPNGQGLLYQLKGVALPPKPEEVIEREIPCKTKYVELLKIKNWLQYPQRFKVEINCLDNHDDPACTCTGFEYLELPALAQKEYSLNFFAYNLGYLKFNVKFVNEETREYVWYDLGFNIRMCGPLEVITLKSGVRQTCHHEIKLENPLEKPIRYTLQTTWPEIHFDNHFHEVSPRGSVYSTLSFTPIHPGENVVMLTASCEELGIFPRELRLVAIEASPNPPRMFETPLGTSQTHEFTVKNFSASNAVLSCKIDSEDFSVSEQGNPAAGQSSSIKVTYEPSEIGSAKATLFVESEQAGNFIFPLLGMCVKPLAKGPYILKPGSGVNIPFKNAFRKTKEFYMYVDNPAFFLRSTQELLQAKEESKIFVSFQKVKHLERMSEYRETVIEPKFPIMGQLVVECYNPYIKWQFYLKGILEK